MILLFTVQQLILSYHYIISSYPIIIYYIYTPKNNSLHANWQVQGLWLGSSRQRLCVVSAPCLDCLAWLNVCRKCKPLGEHNGTWYIHVYIYTVSNHVWHLQHVFTASSIFGQTHALLVSASWIGWCMSAGQGLTAAFVCALSFALAFARLRAPASQSEMFLSLESACNF